jgi:hypothetical protein
MTVAHKDLTGTDLHEIKGASSATAGQVPIANGSGGAPFGKLDATSLTGTGNPFGNNLLHVREEQASGTASQTPATAGGVVNNVLNVVKTNEIAGASLASSQITLPAGTYFIEAHISYLITGSVSQVYYRPRLQNITLASTILDGHTVVVGLGGGGSGNSSIQGISTICGRFTLAGTTVINLQHYKTSAQSPVALNIGPEVYTDVMIWKVA